MKHPAHIQQAADLLHEAAISFDRAAGESAYIYTGGKFYQAGRRQLIEGLRLLGREMPREMPTDPSAPGPG